MISLRNKNIFYLLYWLILASIIAFLSAAATQYFVENINSDYLYLYETAANIMQFYSLAGQNFPPAPYFFPDLFIVILLKSLTLQNITIINFICCASFLSVFLILVYALFRICFNKTNLRFYDMCFAIIFVLCSTFCLIPLDLQYLRQWPASHLSVILFSLFLLIFYLKHRFQQINAFSYVFVTITAFCLFISDNLLFAQAFVPLSIVILFDRLINKNKQNGSIYLLIIFLIVTMMGARIDLILEKYFAASFSLNESLFRIRKISQLDQTFFIALQVVKDNIAQNAFYYFTLICFNLLSAILFLILYPRRRHIAVYKPIALVLAYFYCAQLINLLLAILCGKFTGIGRFRYLDTLHIFPPIALALVVLCYVERKLFIKSICILLSLLLIDYTYGFLQINFSLLKHFSFTAPYNEFVKCIDDLQDTYHIQHGLAEYWDVKEIRMFSKRNIAMTQVDRELQFYNFIDNQHLFTPKPEYQFIIVTPDSDIRSLSTAKIRANIGEPDKILQCTYRQVWLYQSPAKKAKLNQYYANQ